MKRTSDISNWCRNAIKNRAVDLNEIKMFEIGSEYLVYESQ